MRETINSRATNSSFANPEVSFDEANPRPPTASSAGQPQSSVVVANNAGNNSSSMPNRVPMKRPLTLDLNAKISTEGDTKRLRFNSSVNAPVPVLNTPDLQILKNASPELEKFMMANPSLQTPTPSLLCPSKVRKTCNCV